MGTTEFPKNPHYTRERGNNACKCGGILAIIDTRRTKDGTRRRRYYCVSCGERFTTYELTVEQSEEYATWRKKAAEYERLRQLAAAL